MPRRALLRPPGRRPGRRPVRRPVRRPHRCRSRPPWPPVGRRPAGGCGGASAGGHPSPAGPADGSAPPGAPGGGGSGVSRSWENTSPGGRCPGNWPYSEGTWGAPAGAGSSVGPPTAGNALTSSGPLTAVGAGTPAGSPTVEGTVKPAGPPKPTGPPKSAGPPRPYADGAWGAGLLDATGAHSFPSFSPTGLADGFGAGRSPTGTPWREAPDSPQDGGSPVPSTQFPAIPGGSDRTPGTGRSRRLDSGRGRGSRRAENRLGRVAQGSFWRCGNSACRIRRRRAVPPLATAGTTALRYRTVIETVREIQAFPRIRGGSASPPKKLWRGLLPPVRPQTGRVGAASPNDLAAIVRQSLCGGTPRSYGT